MQNRPIRNIACIGEVMIELVTQGDDSARLNVAGDTYNTAVYLSRLLRDTGVTVHYVTALGEDRFSDRILGHMKTHGVADDHVERRPDKVPGLYAIDTDPSGERSFTYWRSDSAARTLFSEPCRIGLDVLDDFDLVFLSGITLAILPAAIRSALIARLDAYRASGGRVAYDSNYRPRLWESVEAARETNMKMWSRTDIALPSVDDEMAIFGDSDEAEVIARLASAGAIRGALKRGEMGPLDLSGDVMALDLPPVKNVVDTTAAGDSFNAGFLAALVRGESAAAALESGHRLASKVIQASGAIVPI